MHDILYFIFLHCQTCPHILLPFIQEIPHSFKHSVSFHSHHCSQNSIVSLCDVIVHPYCFVADLFPAPLRALCTGGGRTEIPPRVLFLPALWKLHRRWRFVHPRVTLQAVLVSQIFSTVYASQEHSHGMHRCGVRGCRNVCFYKCRKMLLTITPKRTVA